VEIATTVPSLPPADAALASGGRGRPGAADALPAAGAALALLLHVPLALLVLRAPALGRLHALAVFAVALFWALSRRPPARIAAAALYLAGAEVFWRMTGAALYWEGVKYAVALVLAIAAWRRGVGKGSTLALAYFALLLPSSVLTAVKNPLGIAVNDLSFNLSGPLAITAGVLFFSGVRMTVPELRRVLLAGTAPIVSTSVVVWRGTSQAELVAFGGSNVALSGGFAPNQVSAILGFGVLLLALVLLAGRTRRLLGAGLLALLLVFATQSAMTFSRGGLYLAASGFVAAALSLRHDAAARRRLLTGALAVALAAAFVIVPRLLSFTGGAIAARFAETSTTGRAEIARADIETWLSSPVFGVGPGQAKQNRGRYFRPEASHTEFTRLLAEHGLFGLAAALCLAALALRAVRAPSPPLSRGLRAALLTWSVLFMSIDGVRLAAPCLAFGLPLVTLVVAAGASARPSLPRRGLDRETPPGPLRPRPASSGGEGPDPW
jgi:O-antigen ligase